MKLLIIFCLTFFSLAQAGGFKTQADYESCLSRPMVYSTRGLCEAAEGQTCYELLPTYNCEYSRLQDSTENDLTKPLYSKNETESCSGESDCQSKLALKSCLDSEESPFINAEYSELYCSKLTGYEQKPYKVGYDDSSLKSAYDSLEAVKQAERDAIANIQKRQKCGSKTKAAMVVKGQLRSLSESQIDQIFTDNNLLIKALDSGASSVESKLAAVVADGTLITQENKDDLIAFFASCIAQ